MCNEWGVLRGTPCFLPKDKPPAAFHTAMILDIQMPVKSGIEVMKEAVMAGIMPLTIILSGYEEFSYVQQAIKYGGRDYMLKPCRSSEMLKPSFRV